MGRFILPAKTNKNWIMLLKNNGVCRLPAMVWFNICFPWGVLKQKPPKILCGFAIAKRMTLQHVDVPAEIKNRNNVRSIANPCLSENSFGGTIHWDYTWVFWFVSTHIRNACWVVYLANPQTCGSHLGAQSISTQVHTGVYGFDCQVWRRVWPGGGRWYGVWPSIASRICCKCCASWVSGNGKSHIAISMKRARIFNNIVQSESYCTEDSTQCVLGRASWLWARVTAHTITIVMCTCRLLKPERVQHLATIY